MKIQVYGTGCPKCVKLAENAALASKQLGVEAEIEKVSDINAITNAGVMMTPALGIDGKIVSTGKVLSAEEIGKFLKDGNTVISEKEEPCCCGSESDISSGAASCCDSTATSCCVGGSKGKKILTILLLALIVFSVIAMIVREAKAPSAVSEESAAQVSADTVEVYYFHGNQRCYTCNQIEELTKKAISDKYTKELADGKIVMRSVNVEIPENEHFIKDFQLSTRSVVMRKGDKYEKFDEVWSLVREPVKFTEYIQKGAAKMLSIESK